MSEQTGQEIAKVPEDEADKVKFVKTLFQQAKTYRENYKKYLDIENLKWYKGEQYKRENMLASHEYVVSNRIFAIIENQLPIMTDNPPQFQYHPQEPSDQPGIDMFNKIVGDYLWNQMTMDMRVPENQKNVLIYGTGFFRPYWDKHVLNGIGDCRVRVQAPQSIFPCPGYTELDENIPYYTIADYVSIAELKKLYGEKADQVKPEGSRDSDVPDPAKDTNKTNNDQSAQVTDTTGEQTEYLPLSNAYGGRDERKVLLLETYINDSDKENYPYGRVLATAGEFFMAEYANDIPCYPTIVKTVDYILPNEFWGMGEITQLKDPQKMINKFKSNIVNILRFTSDPPLVIDVGAMDEDDIDNWINEPGIIIEKAPGLEVRWLEMKMPDVGMINYIQGAEKEINEIAGSHEWTPSKSGALPSGKSLAQMQDIGQTRIRQKIRNMTSALKKLGIIIAKMVLKYYTEPRIMRIAGDEGVPEYLKVFREKNPVMAEQMKQQITEQGLKPVNLEEIKPDFDLKVSIDPALPLSKAAKYEMATNLLQLGALDQQAVLDAIDYPDKEKITKRMQAAAEAKFNQELEIGKAKAALEAKVKTAPKVSVSLKGEDI